MLQMQYFKLINPLYFDKWDSDEADRSSHIHFLGAVHLWRFPIDFEATKGKKSGSIQIF